MAIGTKRSVVIAVCGAITAGFCADARGVPWELYADTASDSVCDVVNAANLELVVLYPTGELVGITGVDSVFLDTYVDQDNFVYYQGDVVGFIEFAEDGDGYRTLWWFTVYDDVANVNEFTGEPTPTGLQPFDFFDVPCDACPYWDVPEECTDTDLDGVEDAFDLCPHTALSEIADIDGCSCDQLDDDWDGVDNCYDLCPNTPADLIAGSDGCACEEIDDDFDGINTCFDLCPNTPTDEYADVDGCSCGQLDDDLDGVNNCYDLCPGTSPIAAVDIDGCVISGVPDDGITISVCGSFGAMIFPVMLFGLVGFRFAGRRSYA